MWRDAKVTGLMALGALVLGACATVEDPETRQRAIAWSQVQSQTEAILIGDNRVRITATTPLAKRLEQLERDLLARAAGEALRRGAPRFSIVFLEYDDKGLGNLFVPQFNDPATGWIGTYEAMLAARANADPDGSLKGGYGFKSMTAVVRLLAEGEEPNRPAFDAQDTYQALINERIDRRGIEAPKRLDLGWPF